MSEISNAIHGSLGLGAEIAVLCSECRIRCRVSKFRYFEGTFFVCDRHGDQAYFMVSKTQKRSRGLEEK